ncbi:3',5'-nucleoside bisphosphate phosphatase [Thiobacillus sp.]|uniref:3',5'-nucleoside bisphosphate phosphatase n=1 Tax=Thiobacillus sp. TaxID=924 RepID=UPI0017E14169|nr:3',5'-nucleoside bisphosphate phosphatase [Thiobacillus sp.]MBC2731448.1 PHP domain-containing protein [Thiobacillus sp.]MBC2740185.1 PHP domain-containing protein [Thiobacillus sp.]MBC2758398.1 PHP domain-containing protein [Thiobacillus sp.]
MLNIDLHCHSNVSDGVLPPAEVVARAAANGVHALALTDHDDVAGLAAAQAAAEGTELALIPGVEISVTWNGQTVHIVGLRIDPVHPELAAGLHNIRMGRIERAQRMGDDLARSGIVGAYEGAYDFAANKQMVGRTHFARWLVAQGHVPDMRSAFRRFLTRGNPGYVEHQWTTLENAVGWIRASGGMAVIAHPGRYAFNARELHLLLDAFRALGGEGIEVITGSHHPSEYGKFADLARAFGLKASRGADFHAPGEGIDIGRLPALPHYCQPVWQGWPELETHFSLSPT